MLVLVHAEVDSAGLPLVGDLDQDGRDQSEQGCFVREESRYPRATLQFSIEPLHDVRCPQSTSQAFIEGEGCQALRDVVLHPFREPRRGLSMRLYGLLLEPLGF